MMRCRAGLVAAALAFALVSTSVRAQTFRTSVDFVLVDVAVRQRGRAVTDLTAHEFVVLDAGVEQRVEDASREALPIDVTLIVDWSGSVSGAVLTSLTRAMESVRAQLRPADRARVVTFSHAIREAGSLPSGTELDVGNILGRPAGQTSLIDAVTVALIRPREPGRRSMAIVFTDGLDTTSFVDGPTLVEVAKRAETAVFIVALAASGASNSRPPHDALFRTLADTTGGVFTVLSADQELGPSFVEAFEEFRTRYVLRYAYQGPVRPGWHPLTVSVTRRGSFEVRARGGYWTQSASD